MLAISLSELECLRLSDCVLIRYAICDKNISLRSKEGRKQSLHEIISWQKRQRPKSSFTLGQFFLGKRQRSKLILLTNFFLGKTSFLSNPLLAKEEKTKVPWSNFFLSQSSLGNRGEDKISLVKLYSISLLAKGTKIKVLSFAKLLS